jgi:putative ABC transport system permease protein
VKRTPLARKNLIERPSRTVVSALGIAFAIVLMFMQLGFLGAVGDTATIVYRRTPADLIIRSPEYLQTFDPRSLDADIVPLVKAIPEVLDVRTLDLGITRWQNPITGEMRAIAIMGVDPSRPALDLPVLKEPSPILNSANHVLIDDATRFDYGPQNGRYFSDLDIGIDTDVTGKRVVIGDVFEMGTGLAANGALLMSHDAFRRLAPDRMTLPSRSQQVSMLIVRLREGVPVIEGQRTIANRITMLGGSMSSAQVLTLEEAKNAERWHWYVRTPIGIIFGIGVALAVIVGGVICYMVLAADVIAKLPEYATLKALGYSNSFLVKTLLGQAAWLAGAAFPPAVIASLTLYAITSFFAGVPITMTTGRIVLVALLSFSMCTAAGWIALRKMTKAEPANLF